MPIFTKVCRYIVLDVEVTTDLIIKLRIRKMVFTKPLVDIHVKYELLKAGDDLEFLPPGKIGGV